MKKAFKIFGIVVGVIIVLIIAAVLILPHVIDPNAYRDDIARAVKARTGRTLTISGDMKLSLVPWIGVDVGQTTFGNAPGFGPQPFATAGEMEVRVRLLSLLFGPTEVGTLRLDDLTVNLARNASGKTNWQDLVQANKRSGDSASSPGSTPQVVVDSIELHNATIDWRDAVADTHYTLRKANFTAGKVVPNQPFPVKTDFVLTSERPFFSANMALKGAASVDPESERYQLNDVAAEVVARGAGLPAQPTRANATWQSLQLDQAAGTFTLMDLKLNALGIEADAVVKGHGLNGQPAISGALTVPDFTPRDVLQRMGRTLKPSDPTVLQNAALSAQLAATQNSATLSDVKMTLDDTHISGQVAVKDFKTRAVAFSLAADKLDADRYLPAGTGNAGKVAQPEAYDHIRLPGEKLEGLNMHGQLTVGRIKAFGLTAQGVKLGIDAANGSVTLKPLTAELYNGRYNGSIRAAAAGKGLKLETDQRLDQVDIGAMLGDFLGKKLLSGKAAANISFSGTGDTVGALEKTLDGKLDFDVKHGALEGIDLWYAIRRAYAVIKRQPAPKESGSQRTEFVALTGTGVIDNGVLNNKTFKADLPFMHLSGHGKINLVSRDVDYKLQAKILKVPDIDRRGELGKLKGVTIPIEMQGDFSSLTAFPDLADVVKTKLKNKLKSRVKDKLKGLLDKKKTGSGGDGSG